MEKTRKRVDDHYAHVMHRLNNVNAMGALAINAVIALSVYRNPPALLWLGGGFLVALPINIWITLVLLKKRDAFFGEAWRIAINVSATLLVYHNIGWPLPVWLLLPFLAVAFDGFKRLMAWTALAVMCIGFGGLAIYDGFAWIYPVSFTVLACFCRIITQTRLHIVRDMFEQSDRQNCELARANSALIATHGQLEAALEARNHAEIELHHAQKLEAVGRLASGIAHEINSPTQFVSDSVVFLKEAFEGYEKIVGAYQHAIERIGASGGHEVLIREVEILENELDLQYLKENVPGSFERCLEGISRISTIVRAMKEFAHPDQRQQAEADLNQALQSTLAIARHEYKYVADLETEFGDLPTVCCYVNELNQAFLNLIVNAAHAVGETVERTGAMGQIRIATRREGDFARIDIADTGSGIPSAVRERIFEPFFTTKEVGRGTGQGLAIARSIVVDKHGGSLTFESEVGRGTTFTVRVPIGGKGPA